MNRGLQSRSSESQSERRREMRRLLAGRKFDELVSLATRDKHAERMLNSLLFDSDELVRWRAVEAFGRIAALRAGRQLEGVREMIRRLLWAMNDESGNSLRHAPELMGEILACVPALIPEYARQLPPLHSVSPYERGVHWAMARIASVAPETFAASTGMLIRSLDDPDPCIRGLALLSLSPEACRVMNPRIRTLEGDGSVLQYYDSATGGFMETTVGAIASARLRHHD